MRSVLENDPFAALVQRPRWTAGIVGGARPSRYSESPALWNTLFGKLGADAAFLAFDLPRVEDLPSFLAAFLDEAGAFELTVTNPYKASAWQALSRLAPGPGLSLTVSDRVKVLGCLNHLIVDRHGGRLIAENTDGVGMRRALEAALGAFRPGVAAGARLAGCRVLLVGSGAAAASIGLELVRSGVSLSIVDLDAADARALAARLAPYAANSLTAGDWGLIPGLASACDVIVSAISAGTPLAVADIARLPAATLLADARYGEAAEFARAALAAGRLANAQVLDGRAMLFGQFAAAAALACPIVGAGSEAIEAALAQMSAASSTMRSA